MIHPGLEKLLVSLQSAGLDAVALNPGSDMKKPELAKTSLSGRKES